MQIKNITKRLIDIIFSAILLVIFAPVILLFALIIFIQSKEFPFYSQYRALTLEKKQFKVIKLKTLYSNSISTVKNPLIKMDLKKHLIPFGSFLRHTGLDELPQLINVLKGDMSLIGPRPLTIDDLLLIKKYDIDAYNKRNEINFRPGLTGYWQIYGNRLKGINNLIENDLYYANNQSLILDLKILFATIPMVLFAKHSDAIDFNVDKREVIITEEIYLQD